MVWQSPADALRTCADAGLVPVDAIQVECTLRDAHGNIARNELVVSATVEGGTLLGLENGDLSDNSLYALPQRQSFDGRLIVYVRPGGPTILQLNAPGLPDVRVEI